MPYLTSLPIAVLYEVFAYLDGQTFGQLALTSSALASIANQVPRCFKVFVGVSEVIHGPVDTRLRNIALLDPTSYTTNVYANWRAAFLKQKSCPWVKYIRSMRIQKCLEWYPPNVQSMLIPAWAGEAEGIPADNLPKTLLDLTIQGYRQQLHPKVLPMGLLKLSFVYGFNQILKVGVLPSTLRKLELGQDYNQPLHPYALPESLEELDLGAAFNQTLEVGVLPETLRRLMLGSRYNQPLHSYALPDSLEELDLGIAFNHPLQPHVLPPNLVALNFSTNFNHPLEPGILPPGLQMLRLYCGFNQQLQPGALPQSLLALDWNMGMEIKIYPGILPPNLIALHLSTTHAAAVRTEALPQSLRTLQIDGQVVGSLQPDLLPTHLDVLQIRSESIISPTFATKAQIFINGLDKSRIIARRLSTEFPELVERLTRINFF